jgi:hypothetical protein
LKIKAFILEKFLDTAFQALIRFFPESSDGFLNFRWNYSPLKEKAAPLPGGLSRLFMSLRSKPLYSFASINSPHAPEAGGSARESALPRIFLFKDVAPLQTARRLRFDQLSSCS